GRVLFANSLANDRERGSVTPEPGALSEWPAEARLVQKDGREPPVRLNKLSSAAGEGRLFLAVAV
ncbi:MAG: hypothetical protein LDL55_08690, partial [Armatimonadetes bacterium]|nr:hypothetical protein [Armatimonadota bacterium]